MIKQSQNFVWEWTTPAGLEDLMKHLPIYDHPYFQKNNSSQKKRRLMEKVELTLSGKEGASPVITILEGSTLELKEPNQIELNGNIQTVSKYLNKRYNHGEGAGLQFVDLQKAVVEVDEDSRTIQLFLDPENYYGATVKGCLLVTEELKQFCINTTKQWTREELIKLLKFNKRFFDTPGAYETLLTSYQKLNLSTQSELKNENDTRGNRDVAFKKSIATTVPLEFILALPIFRGQAIERFRVEICLDVTEASVRFWLESVELIELMDKRCKEIFDLELVSCKDLVVIYK